MKYKTDTSTVTYWYWLADNRTVVHPFIQLTDFCMGNVLPFKA
ncbi:hypothetical protein [Lentibacillus cibarius]|nr:hypothetical protein [Lentibacillus cibarius]